MRALDLMSVPILKPLCLYLFFKTTTNLGQHRLSMNSIYMYGPLPMGLFTINRIFCHRFCICSLKFNKQVRFFHNLYAL